MLHKNKKSAVILYIAFLFFLFAEPTHAYIDPGTGSFLFQLLIAGILGSTFFLKTAVRSMKAFVNEKIFSKKKVEGNLMQDKKNE